MGACPVFLIHTKPTYPPARLAAVNRADSKPVPVMGNDMDEITLVRRGRYSTCFKTILSPSVLVRACPPASNLPQSEALI
jgi:hypothetical protein